MMTTHEQELHHIQLNAERGLSLDEQQDMQFYDPIAEVHNHHMTDVQAELESDEVTILMLKIMSKYNIPLAIFFKDLLKTRDLQPGVKAFCELMSGPAQQATRNAVIIVADSNDVRIV